VVKNFKPKTITIKRDQGVKVVGRACNAEHRGWIHEPTFTRPTRLSTRAALGRATPVIAIQQLAIGEALNSGAQSGHD